MDNIRVLIVDDLAHVRQSLASVLELASKNFPTRVEVIGEAENGQEAIRQAEELQPDVILMDLEMPVLDGFKATRSIKQANPKVGVIVLSIHDDPDARRKAMQAGADAFLEKDTPLEMLLQAVRNVKHTFEKE